ncbi:restriction endonuclease subunit S, partial [Methanosphaera cuniculi]|uniref:restriction endonuclease subunit S n=1 Tax=Methanosphaera cuniculi TaxID=1077256 RepID=UPI0026EEA8B6
PPKIPILHFPHFTKSWDKKILAKIAKIGDGVHQTPNYIDSGVKFISVEDIDDFSKSNKFIEKKEYDKYKMKTQKNDIFLTRIGTVGKSNILKEDTNYAYYVSLSLIRPNKEINSNYLNQYIKSNIFQRELWKRTLQNASPMKINLIDLKQCPVAFPSIKEQEKIGTFLSKIDGKIALMKQEYKSILNFRSYLIQTLFNNDLDAHKTVLKSVDKISKSENIYEDTSKYHVFKISDLFEFSKGQGLSKEDFTENGRYYCILYGELYKYNEIIQKIDTKTNSQEGKIGKYGDILIPSSNKDKNNRYVTASVLLEDDVKIGNDIIILKNKRKDLVDEIFFAYYFSNAIKKDIAKLTQGITITHLYWKDFKDLKIKIPSLETQKIISEFLLCVEDKLVLIKKSINLMKTYKQGLLQKMFI